MILLDFGKLLFPWNIFLLSKVNCNHQRVTDSGTMSHVRYDDSSRLGGENRAVNSPIFDMAVCNEVFVVASF